MPLPGSAVIAAGWEEHHQPVAEGGFTARCRLRDPAGDSPTYNPATGTYSTVKAAAYYDGSCRLQQQRQPQTAETAGQTVSVHEYLVQIPKTVTAVEVRHVAEIYDASDASLNGRQLEVSDVMRGSLTWSRDLICLDNLGR